MRYLYSHLWVYETSSFVELSVALVFRGQAKETCDRSNRKYVSLQESIDCENEW